MEANNNKFECKLAVQPGIPGYHTNAKTSRRALAREVPAVLLIQFASTLVLCSHGSMFRQADGFAILVRCGLLASFENPECRCHINYVSESLPVFP